MTNSNSSRTSRPVPKSRVKQAGMSMLQMIVILIISAILVMAGIFSMKYIEDAKVNNELEELASLSGSTMLLAQLRGGNFTGVDLATVAGLNFFPRQRVSGTGTNTVVTNQWKGTITVAAAKTISESDSLAFTYSGVPSSACKQLMIPAAQIAVEISVGETSVKSNGNALALASAMKQCEDAANNATIVYTLAK